MKQVKIMGKGDRKTKKGKIHQGTFGVRRPKKKLTAALAPVAKKKPAAAKAKATTAKKPAAKKAKTAAKAKPKAEETAE